MCICECKYVVLINGSFFSLSLSFFRSFWLCVPRNRFGWCFLVICMAFDSNSTIIVTAKTERLSPPNNQQIRSQQMPSQPSTPLQQPQPNNGTKNTMQIVFIIGFFCCCTLEKLLFKLHFN